MPPARSVVVKARVSPEQARRLRRLAKAENKTESDLVREGLDLVARLRARRAFAPRLAEFIGEKDPDYKARL